MRKIKKPIAKIGDTIVGPLHPLKGYMMIEVDHAYRKDFYWIFVDMDGNEIHELNIDHIIKRRGR